MSIDDPQDEDRQAVERLFKWVFDTTSSLAPEFQVIITDQADLKHDWFQDAIVGRWPRDEKLIPASWYW